MSLLDNVLSAPAVFAGTPDAGFSDDSLYAAYVRSGAQATATRAADAFVPSFAAPASSPLQLDPDPFGDQTAAIARRTGLEVPRDSVQYLDVFGERKTREELMASEDGRRLVKLADRNRQGRRRGFLDAIWSGWSLADAPFLSLLSSFGSMSDARMVADTMRKLQNGEPTTEEERLKTRLYIEDSQWKSNGTWGATFGDIVRQAPGFMAEFFVSGGIGQVVRTAAAKAAGETGVHLALSFAEKSFARTATEAVAAKAARNAGFESGWKGLAKVVTDASKSKKVVDDVAESLYNFMKMAKTSPVSSSADDVFLRNLARNRAEYEMRKFALRTTSDKAVTRAWHQFAQWAGRHASSGLIDFGSWGTDGSRALVTGFTKPSDMLADAVGAMFVEPWLRGSLLMAPNALVVKPLLEKASGGRVVSEAELGLRLSSLLQKNPQLMDEAEALAAGMNWLEYVSENAGRGFGSLMRGVGLWLDRGAVRGIVRPAARDTLSAASADVGSEGFRIGGALRRMWESRFGTRAMQRENLEAEKAMAVKMALDSRLGHAVDERAVRRAVMSGSARELPADAAAAVGPDFEKFAKSAVEAAFQVPGGSHKYKTFGLFMFADWMNRHNVGPDMLLNLYEQAGYDGVLGEMLEERYADVAKGLFGWNDKKDQSIKARLANAVEGLWPGFDQLTAEAAGFSVPMVSRMAVARIQSAIGGEGAYARVRRNLDQLRDAMAAGAVVEMHYGDFLKVRDAQVKEDEARVADLQSRVDAAKRAGADSAALEEELSVARTRRDRNDETWATWMKTVDEDKATKEAIESLGENAMVVVEPLARSTAEGDKATFDMRPVRASSETVRSLDARQSVIDYSPELARTLWELDGPLEGERSPSFLRSVAHRLVGIAGAVVTGDLGMAVRDAASWVSRDAGVDQNVVKMFRAGFHRTREEVKRRLLDEARTGAIERRMEELALYGATRPAPGETFSIPEKYVTDVAEREFAPVARRVMETYLAMRHMRTFTKSQMADAALAMVAREAGYDVVDAQGRTFAKTSGDPARKIVRTEEYDYDDYWYTSKSVDRPRVWSVVDDMLASAGYKRFGAPEPRNFGTRSSPLYAEDVRFDLALPAADGTADEHVVMSYDKKTRLDRRTAIGDRGMWAHDHQAEVDAEIERLARKQGFEIDKRGSDRRLDWRMRRTTEETPSGVDESTRIGFDQFLDQPAEPAQEGPVRTYRDVVDERARRMSRAVLDLLANRTNVSVDDRLRVALDVEMPSTSDLADVATYDAALRLAGFSHVIPRAWIREDRSLEQTLEDTAVKTVSSSLLSAIAQQAANPDGTYDPGKVSRELIESLAWTMSAKFDATSKSLEERDRRLVEFAALAYRFAQSKAGSRFFRVFEDPRDDADMRRRDGASVIVEARRNAKGLWEIRDQYVPGANTRTFEAETEDEMVAKLKEVAPNAERADPRIVFTQARVLETDSLVDMLRATRLLREYAESMEDAKFVHPLFRKRADGSFLFDEKGAAEQVEIEKALAAESDGKHLVVPLDGVTADEYRRRENAAVSAWQMLYGDDGYVARGEAMLRRRNVDVSGALDVGTGRRHAARYQMRMTTFMSRNMDFYVPVDVARVGNLRDALLDATLLHAYALNARLLWNAFGPRIADFCDQLDALCLHRQRQAERDGNPVLAEQLRDFRLFATARPNRVVRNADGERRVVRGAGLTAGGFAAMASVFCCFREKRDAAEGLSRVPHVGAMLEIADEARMLPAFIGFASAVDVALGGDGFLDERARRPGEEPDGSRGLPGLLRAFHNDPEALSRLMENVRPGGVPLEEFLAQADNQLAALGRPPIAQERSRRLRETATSVRTMDAYKEWFREFVDATGLAGDALRGLISSSLKLARATAGGKLPAEGQAAVAAVNAAVDAAEQLAREKTALPELLDKYREAKALAASAEEKLAAAQKDYGAMQERVIALQRELDARPDSPAVKTALDAATAGREQAAQAMNAAAEAAEAARGDATAASEKAGKAATQLGLGRIMKHDVDGDNGAADALDPEDEDDGTGGVRWSVDTADEEDLLPDEMSMYSYETTLPGPFDTRGLELSVGSNLTQEEARAAAAAVLKLVQARPDTTVAAALSTLFPALPDEDRRRVKETFDEARRRKGSKSWSDIAAEGIGWDFAESDKEDNEGADTSSEGRSVVRRTLDELNGKGLRLFLKLARFAAPGTAANLQAFLGGTRDRARRAAYRSGDALRPEDAFIRNLVSPRERTDFMGEALDTYNKADAAFERTLRTFDEDPAAVSAHVGSFADRGLPREAFLLAFLSAMTPDGRERFSRLVGQAAACDTMRSDGRRTESADPDTKRVQVAAAVGVFSPLAGRDRSYALDVAERLAVVSKYLGVDAGMERRGDFNNYAQAYDDFCRNADRLADELEPVFGEGSVLVDVLRSRELRAHLLRSSRDSESGANRLAGTVLNAMTPYRGYYGAGSGAVIPMLETLVGAFRTLGAGSGLITSAETETIAVAAFSTGDARQGSVDVATRSSRNDNELSTLFTLYASSLPPTVMTAEVTPGRQTNAAKSVAITSPGLPPLSLRWLYSDASDGFRALVDSRFGSRQSPDVPSNADYVAREAAEMVAEGSTLQGAELRKAALDRLVARCRQTMEWPDGTRIFAKNISTGYRQDEIYRANATQFAEMSGFDKTFYVSVYTGDHSAALHVQAPKQLLSDERLAARRKSAEDVRKLRSGTPEFAEARARHEKFLRDMYKDVATELGLAMGLGLLGDDAKRSLVSCTERPAVSTIGVDVESAPGEDGGPAAARPAFGTCTVVIPVNFKSRKAAQPPTRPGAEAEAAQRNENRPLGNENFKGNTFLFGYGADRQRRCQRVRNTGTLKVHVASTGGRGLNVVKSLVLSPDDSRGKYLAGDPKLGAWKLAQRFCKNPTRDSALVADLDSVKVATVASKWVVVDDGGVAKNVLEYVVDRLDEEFGLSSDDPGSLPAGFDLAGHFEGVPLTEYGAPRKGGLSGLIREIGLEVSDDVDGFNGKTIALSFTDDTLATYDVANVSHDAKVADGRSPRNYVVDGMMVAAGYVKSGLAKNTKPMRDVFSLVGDWGLAVAAVYGRQETISTLIGESSGLKALRDAGESPDGEAMKEELFRTAWKRMRDSLNIPMDGIDAVLVSNGAGASVLRDADGNVLHDERGRPMMSQLSTSRMLNELNYGSVVFSKAERAFWGADRRLANCAVNSGMRSTRYGWWLDDAEFAKQFNDGVEMSDRDVVVRLEQEFTRLHDAETASGAADVAARRRLMSCFVDHHGKSMARLADEDVGSILFDDLFFADRQSDATVFDRTAVHANVDGFDDRVFNDATGESHVYLAGTAFGLPRTPSHNGTRWLQAVRASVPVTEIEVRGSDGSTVDYVPGKDAMVSPDPQTYEILGCDNDGDKAKLYTLAGAGVADFAGVPSLLDGVAAADEQSVLDRFAESPDGRKEYYDRLVEAGFVREKFDPHTGLTTRRISDAARRSASNRLVRSLLTMARWLPCPETTGSDGADVRVPFIGGPASQPTKAFPGSAGALKELLKTDFPFPGSKKAIPDGHRLAEPDLAADVVAKANDVADMRAQVVSLMKTIHLAWMSGMYDDVFDGAGFMKFNMFLENADGLSNATFDDLKNQLCSRFGWTDGMATAVVVDFFLNYDPETDTFVKGLPTDDAAFDRVVRHYVTDVNSYGSRHFIRMATDPIDAFGFHAGIRSRIENAGWTGVFGLAQKTTDDGRTYWDVDSQAVNRKAMTAGQLVADVVDDVLRMRSRYGISDDVGRSRILGMLAYSGRANAATPGYLLYLAAKAAGADTSASPEDVASKVLNSSIDVDALAQETRDELAREVARFVKWHLVSMRVEDARDFGASFDYLSVDPGADDAALKARRALERGHMMKTRKEPPVAPAFDFPALYRRMHAVVRVAHSLGYGLETVVTRAVSANDRRDDYLARLGKRAWDARDGELAAIRTGLMSLDPLPRWDRFGMKALAQSTPFVITALQEHGTSPAENLKMLGRIADVVDAKRFDALPAAANETMREQRDSRRITLALGGVNMLFEAMYRLATTSTEHFQRNAAFSYFLEREFNGDVVDYRIVPKFGGSTDVFMSRAQDAVREIMEGRAFSGARVRADGRPTKAASFALTADNLAALRSEISKSSPYHAELDYVEAIVEAIGPVTPQRMFNELLPLYTALASRTTGAPTPGSSSLLTLLPGVYEKWSARQALNDVKDRELVDAALSVSFAPVDPGMRLRGAQPFSISDDAYFGAGDAAPGESVQEYRRRAAAYVRNVPASELPDVPLQAQRQNENRYSTVVDVFAGGGVLSLIATRLLNTPVPAARRESTMGAQAAKDLREGLSRRRVKFDERDAADYAKRFAYAMRGMAPWADVEFVGPTTFVLRGDIRDGVTSSASTAAKAVITVDVSEHGAFCDSEEDVESLAGSPAYAASLVAVKGAAIGIPSAKAFMRLPLSVRKAIVRRYGIGAASTSNVAWTIDRRGLGVLCGAIRVGAGRGETKIYHEYFHAMVSMYRQLGLFSAADVKALRAAFGRPPPGTDQLFDEERAAEEFRKFVAGRTSKAARGGSAGGVFRKLLDFVKNLFREIARGFSYDAQDPQRTKDVLFGLVVSGVAMKSDGALAADNVADATEIGRRIGWSARNAMLVYDPSIQGVRPTEPADKIVDGRTLAKSKKPAAGTVRRATAEEARLYAQYDLSLALGTEGVAMRPAADETVTDAMMDSAAAARAKPVVAAKSMAAVELLESADAPEAAIADAIADLAGAMGSLGYRALVRAESAEAPESAEGVEQMEDRGRLERFRAAVELAAPPLASKTVPAYVAGRAVLDAALQALSADGAWSTGVERAKRMFAGMPAYDARNATAEDMAAVRRGVMDAVRAVDPAAAKKLASDAKLMDSVAFEVALSAYQSLAGFVAQDKAGSPEGHLGRMSPDAAKLAALKAHASAYDVSAWLLMSSGASVGQGLEDAYDAVGDLVDAVDERGRPRLSENTRDVMRTMVLDPLDELYGLIGDDAGLVEHVAKGSQDRLDEIVQSMVAGLNYLGMDENGVPLDYSLVDENLTDNGASKSNVGLLRNILRPENPEYGLVQEILKTGACAAFRAIASVKYARELGVVPAKEADVAYAHQVEGMHARNQTAAEWCAEHAIGNSNLLDNEGLVDFYDQPYFVAENMEAWAASAVRPSFNGYGIREAATEGLHEYAGILHDLGDLDNYTAMLFGTAVEHGGLLHAPVVHRDRFVMEHGEAKRRDGATRVGFDGYGNKRADVRQTEENYRTTDMFLKSALVWAKGQKKMLTGVDRIWFTEKDADLTRDQLSMENNEAAFASVGSGRKMTRFQMTLHRMVQQLPGSVLRVDDRNRGMGVYDRFADAAFAAIAKARDRRDALRNRERAGTMTDDDRRDLLEFDFNAQVLAELESTGHVLVRKDAGNRSQAVLVLDVDEVDAMFRGSEAHENLVSDDRWAAASDVPKAERAKMLSREEVARQWVGKWRELARFVAARPWITAGDARHLTRFNTPLPFFEGSGVFMYHATRAVRDEQGRPRAERLAGAESTFLWACTSKTHAYRLSETPDEDRGRVSELLGIIRDAGDLRAVPVGDMRRAFVDGDFGPRGKYADLARERGMSVPKDPTLAELSDIAYELMTERALREAEGQTPEKFRSLEQMIEIYESERGRGGALVGGLGVSDDAMYRSRGVLPANFQIGHAVRRAAEQVTNALMHRSTFMTMMLTPSYDGAPVYYARPDDAADRLSGVPDECWGHIARWWADFHGLRYDESASGVRNAQRIYDLVRGKGMPVKGNKRGWRLVSGLSDHRYVALNDGDSDLQSISGILCQEDEELGNGSTLLNAIGEGEAAGYMKQFAQAGRTLGFLPARMNMHRALSWSKALSVSFSFFFPLATRFESPIGAVGAIPTMLGNSKAGAGFLRANPELFNALQRLFGGTGWITKDFIGFADIVDMMDKRDPFLAEMVSWAHALGITISDSLMNPMEQSRSIVEADIRALKDLLRRSGAPEIASRFGRVMDALMLRSGDKAFRYALNATKLAVVAQLCMKLRHEARRAGRAFDPVRDLRRYAGYVNAEIGGIDERRYAWAHPIVRGIMNTLMFSWQWTRGAWEAGGGNAIEDLVLGGHSTTAEERQYLLGRWARMFGEIMIGVPALMQILSKGFALAMGRDDEDDKWFTWQNEDKTRWNAFDITPLMKAVHMHERTAGYVARAAGAALGYLKAGVPGLVAGAAAGAAAMPNYRGSDAANQATRNRRYYMHFGKQGWEFFRWFQDPVAQFFGKLSMPTQRILEGAFGRNLGYLDRELPWADQGPLERWLNPTSSGALTNLLKAYLSFSANGIMTFGDAGILPVFGPVQMGASQTAIHKRLVKAVDAWASNDRAGYSWAGVRASGKRAKALAGRFQDILADARRNGLDPEAVLSSAIGEVLTKKYSQLFRLLPEDASADFDARAVEKVARQLARLAAKKKQVLASVKKRLANQHRDWTGLTPETRRLLERVLGRVLPDPFSGADAVRNEMKRAEKERDY